MNKFSKDGVIQDYGFEPPGFFGDVTGATKSTFSGKGHLFSYPFPIQPIEWQIYQPNIKSPFEKNYLEI